jgi:protein N-lysine methyltransferase METTL21D
MFPLPAHKTKDVSLLEYPLTSYQTVQIVQKAPLNSVSTGTTLYLSSQLLAHCVQETHPKGRNAIELGAGTGLVSIALGKSGWTVWSTDLSNVIDDVLRFNIERNREENKVVVQELDWCRENWNWIYPPGTEDKMKTNMPEFDLIVCADGIYATELINPLLRTLKALSGSTSPLILMAFERRDTAVIDSFLTQSGVDGFISKRINLRRILGRHFQRWGWTPEDTHSAEIWSMRYKPKPTDDVSKLSSLDPKTQSQAS